jgi:hypothetical protein
MESSKTKAYYSLDSRPEDSLDPPSTAISTPLLLSPNVSSFKVPSPSWFGAKVHVSCRRGTEEDGHASNILGFAQSAQWVVRSQGPITSKIVNETAGEFGRKEAGSDDVCGDVAWAQLDGEVPAEVLSRVSMRGFPGLGLLTLAAALEAEYMMVPCSPT